MKPFTISDYLTMIKPKPSKPYSYLPVEHQSPKAYYEHHRDTFDRLSADIETTGETLAAEVYGLQMQPYQHKPQD